MEFLIFSSFLPEGLLLHFDIIDFKELLYLQTLNEYICLDEINILPKGFYALKCESKRFYEKTIIQDFHKRESSLFMYKIAKKA